MSNLLRHGAHKDKVNEIGDSPLILASKGGHLSTVKVLLEGGADVDIISEGSSSALGVAVEFGHIDVMEVILGAGAEVDAAFCDGFTALHYAALHNELDAIDILIKAGADTEKKYDGDNLTPLLTAAGQEHFEAMCALLRHGANPNAKDYSGGTALHMICLSPKVGFEAVVDQLLCGERTKLSGTRIEIPQQVTSISRETFSA